MNVTHSQFMSAFTRQMQGNYAANQDQEIIILGAVDLYWTHSKNVSYLQHAMQYARGRKGIRVNAVKAFFDAFTGAVFDKEKNTYAKSGRAMKECPNDFKGLASWLEWADKEAAEPEYNLIKQQLKVIQFLQNQKKVAIEHDQQEMADMLSQTIVTYVQAQKKQAVQVA
jgi:hypothetical protein